MKLSLEELTAKYQELSAKGGPLRGLFDVVKVDHVNYKVDGLAGHPFTIGAEHVAHAADHCGGMLGTETMEQIPCAAECRGADYPRGRGKCGRPLHAHTYDTCLFLRLVRNLANAEAGSALFAIKETMIADGIDGVGLLESPEKFRIAPQEGTTT